ncbi:MAG: hypothetical protein HC773_03190 [Scytonema sp. CRU_2_7]|nr:hypothetical protein [Scytonema sp. CRU_2_7]
MKNGTVLQADPGRCDRQIPSWRSDRKGSYPLLHTYQMSPRLENPSRASKSL